MTGSSTLGSKTVRSVLALGAAGAIAAALAGCTPDEPRSDTPGTTPSVVTGNQAPPGSVDDADGIPNSSKESATAELKDTCLLYTSPSPRDRQKSRMPSSA